jgi:oxygen-dependent protoporphyrinogen oxidase
MLAGVYTADPERLSLHSTMPQFIEHEEKYASVIVGLQQEGRAKAAQAKKDGGARYSMFLSFDRGMGVLVETLVERLNGTELLLSTKVQKIERRISGWTIRTADGTTRNCDVLIVTVPTDKAAALLEGEDRGDQEMHDLRSKLAEIPFASSVVLNLVYKRAQVPKALAGFGFVVPAVEKRDIIACSYSSVKFPGRSPDDHVTLRAFLGGEMHPEKMELTDEQLVSQALHDLRHYLGITTDPIWHQVARWPNSMPLYHVGHKKLIQEITEKIERMPGLFLAGNAFNGVGVPDCIRSGDNAAKSALRYFNENTKRQTYGISSEAPST